MTREEIMERLEHDGTVLDLDGTSVSDAGLAHLAGLTGLRWLYLYSTSVSDAGLAHLAGLTGLQWLYLSDTGVTDAGVAAFRAAHPGCEVYK